MIISYKEKEIEVKERIKISELLKEEIEKTEYPVVGAKFNNEYQNLDFEIETDGKIELIDISQKEGMNIYRRTLVFIMGKAFEEIYPDSKVKVNYQLDNSMYCTTDNIVITDEFINNIKSKMAKIISANLKIDKIKLTRKEAEMFFKKNHTSKGRLQVDFKENDTIYMYKCEEYCNYFYGEIATYTGVTNVFDVDEYNNGFLIRYPSTARPQELPVVKQTKKLAWALEEYDKIHKILNVYNVYKLNSAVKESRIKDIIMIDEALHEKKIANIADKIAERKGIKMILIAGPSSSGKTTFAQRLGIQLLLNGLKPVTISVDNYFVERVDNPKTPEGEYDFECIEAIDTELLNEHLTKLLNGEEIEMPEFDFKVGTKRYNGKKMKLAEDEILVMEGIHCLNDKLTSRIPKEQKYKIYISALTVLNMDNYNRISTTDTRLVRRMVRDYQFRGYSAKETIDTWPKVNEGELQNIFPFQESADSIFNTSLIYELGALKNIATKLLEEITPNDKQYAEARRIMNMLKFFEPIPAELIPTNSLIKEFLGGGDFRQ
jgi:uridine kinase